MTRIQIFLISTALLVAGLVECQFLPKFPNLPSVPGVPKLPDIPDVQILPSFPNDPNLSSLRNIPTVPSVPFAPAVPVIQGARKIAADVVTPIETGLIEFLPQCKILQKILNITPLDDDNIDFSKLTLELWRGVSKTQYPLTESFSRLLEARSLNFDSPLTIFLHGFLSTTESDAVVEVTKALVDKLDVNVLALDSSSLLSYFYLKANVCVKAIGTALGRALAQFVKGGVDPKKIHIIGHSLGSHIAGFAGKVFQDLTNTSIGRISGLDPAGPCFFREHPEFKLNSTDADFVDVIHTDAGVLGIKDPLGHVDYYPNGGEKQPNCVIPPCSHSRAWQLFSESITSLRFPSVKCGGWDTFSSGGCVDAETNYMGYWADPSKPGQFYLATKGEPPYSFYVF